MNLSFNVGESVWLLDIDGSPSREYTFIEMQYDYVTSHPVYVFKLSSFAGASELRLKVGEVITRLTTLDPNAGRKLSCKEVKEIECLVEDKIEAVNRYNWRNIEGKIEGKIEEACDDVHCKVDELEDDLNDVSNFVDEVNDKYSAIESEVEDLDKMVGGLDEKVEDVYSRVGDLERLINNLNQPKEVFDKDRIPYFRDDGDMINYALKNDLIIITANQRRMDTLKQLCRNHHFDIPEMFLHCNLHNSMLGCSFNAIIDQASIFFNALIPKHITVIGFS